MNEINVKIGPMEILIEASDNFFFFYGVMTANIYKI